MSNGQCIYDSVLTEPPLTNLLRRQGKHRQQFNHYLDYDISQHRSGRDHRIDLETLEEIAQTLEEIQEGIIARCNPSRSLAYSYITMVLL